MTKKLLDDFPLKMLFQMQHTSNEYGPVKWHIRHIRIKKKKFCSTRLSFKTQFKIELILLLFNRFILKTQSKIVLILLLSGNTNAWNKPCNTSSWLKPDTWYGFLLVLDLISQMQTHKKIHRGANKLTNSYKYMLTPPVMCSCKLPVLHQMNNLLISKKY